MKAGDVIGRSITVRDGGQEIGKVKDLVVDQTGREVIGIILAEGLFTGSRVAPWKAVQAFGPDSVVIDAATSVVKGSAEPDIKEVLSKKNKIKGLKLLTTKGKELGKIVDFSFDDTTGDVTGYELSSGLFSDTFEGNPFLPTPKWIELGKDVAFVAPEVEPTIRASTGGIKGAFKRSEKPVVAPPTAPKEAVSDAPSAGDSTDGDGV